MKTKARLVLALVLLTTPACSPSAPKGGASADKANAVADAVADDLAKRGGADPEYRKTHPPKASGTKIPFNYFECGNAATNTANALPNDDKRTEKFDPRGIKVFGYKASDVSLLDKQNRITNIEGDKSEIVSTIEKLYKAPCKSENDKIHQCYFEPSESYDENPHTYLGIIDVKGGVLIDCAESLY